MTIVRETPPQFRNMHGGRNKYRPGAAIELDEGRGQPVQLPAMQTALANDAVQLFLLKSIKTVPC